MSRNNSYTLEGGRGYALEVHPPTQGNIQALDFDYDNFWRATDKALIKINDTRYPALSDWQATGANRNGISVLPAFRDPATGDFNVIGPNPLRDAGIPIPGVNTDYTGPAPDIGACEAAEHL